MRLIDADKVEKVLTFRGESIGDYSVGVKEGLDVSRQVVENAPTIDAVSVVRCRDCKHWANGLREERPCNKTGAYPMRSEDYCSYGAKMEDKPCG